MNDFVNKIGELSLAEANDVIKGICGIINFFASTEEKNNFISEFCYRSDSVCEDRASYGDWQTPETLAYSICKKHIKQYGNPDILIEPTCGLGAFVMSAMDVFPDLREIYALDINPAYTRTLKLQILKKALNKPMQSYPDIYIYTANFFDFDFSDIFRRIENNHWNLALIGNPPWVTNSHQGLYDSDNIPVKVNQSGLRGIDAITGKSNFDISEYITLYLLELSNNISGGVSFLLKNSVIRNIITKQKSHPLNISEIKQESIDAAKEFNVSVAASCFSANLGCSPCFICEHNDFYTGSIKSTYGWFKNLFVANIETYGEYSRFDGTSSFIWRSGIKHDCASVLELEKQGEQYINGFGEVVSIEENLIFPLIKSSDINKHDLSYNRFIIVPQRCVGESTSSLRSLYPKTYSYLESHEEIFRKRKSSIYKNKDRFSIFGIGDYTFKPYKIVVSSLYKTINFRTLSPVFGRPIIVDDTCYQLGFDSIDEAETVLKALQSSEIQQLLKSLIFSDAKRVLTKALLMRLDIRKYCMENAMMLPSEKQPVYIQPSLFDEELAQ